MESMEMEMREEEDVPRVLTETNHEKRHFNDVDRGWAWVVLFACFMLMFFIGGCVTAVGIIHIYLLEAFEESNTKTAWVGALCSGCLNLLGPVTSIISNRWSCRICIFVGGVLGPGALAIGSQAGSLGMAFLTIGILAGIGFGLVTTPILAVAGYYFKRHRSVVGGVIVVGVPFGMMSAPACLTWLESRYGWRGALLLFSGVLLNTCVMAALLKPSELEKGYALNNWKRADSKNKARNICGGLRQYAETLRYKAFVFYVLAISLSNFSVSILYLHLPKYSLSQGASWRDLQMIYLAMGIGNIVSKLLTGVGSGRIRNGESLERFCLLLGAYSMAGTALCVLPTVSHSQIGRLICFCVVSFYYNVEPSLFIPVTLDLVGLKNLHTALGLEMFGVGVGNIIGPPLAAFVRQISGAYKYTFYLAGLSFFLASVCCLMMMKMRKTEDPHDEEHVLKTPEENRRST